MSKILKNALNLYPKNKLLSFLIKSMFLLSKRIHSAEEEKQETSLSKFRYAMD